MQRDITTILTYLALSQGTGVVGEICEDEEVLEVGQTAEVDDVGEVGETYRQGRCKR